MISPAHATRDYPRVVAKARETTTGTSPAHHTHEVQNQPPSIAGFDALACDPALTDALRREGRVAVLDASAATGEGFSDVAAWLERATCAS